MSEEDFVGIAGITCARGALPARARGLTGMLAGIFSSGGGRNISPLAREDLRRAALESLKRLVERHLHSPALCAEFICTRSGWSRATVYRLFEPEGGVARYIRRQHLLRAFRDLMSGQQRCRRIIDVAVAHQFSSEATFNRAFRRAFGIPPGEVRDLAANSRAAPAEPYLPTGSPSEALDWIMRPRGAGERPPMNP